MTILVVFLLVCAYLFWISATRLSLLGENDEGIYVDGGLRILHAQMPYKDFFSLSGPGSFFLVAASLWSFGVNLAAARMPAIFDLALLTSCVCWLTWKLAGRVAAIVTAVTFVSLETLWQGVQVNHRWDSSAWMTLAAALVFYALAREQRDDRSVMASAAAGLAATVAVSCTPPVAIAGAALFVCLLFAAKRLAVSFFAGVTLACALYFGVLASRGAIEPMIRSMAWASRNYGVANRTYYGWVIGGYGNLFRDAAGVQLLVTALILVFITLPATLPFFSALWVWKRPPLPIVALLACGAGLILSSYPRWDLIHLNYVAALFYVLAGSLIATFRFRKTAALAAIFAAALGLGLTANRRLTETSRATPFGVVHGNPADLEAMAMLQQHVRPSDTLFVFPYRPVAYFLTAARNPTRYSFMQPGMFPESDANQALRELQAEPPHWLIYSDVPDAEILRIWPVSDPARLHMTGIESFIRDRYRKIDQSSELQLLELK